jgi:uncharacterized DUF497 family protein
MLTNIYYSMRLGYDPAKNVWNINERGLSFDAVATIDWARAIVRHDTRKNYGVTRYQALADEFDGKPYVVVFTMRGDTMWVISFRRAHAKKRYTHGEKA